MAYIFHFPDLGEGVHEGKIVKWLVREGDVVKTDQVLGEVETDKAVVEIPSPSAGTILKLYFPEGGVIRVGQILTAIGAPEEQAPAQVEEHGAAPAEKAKVEVLSQAQEHKLGDGDSKIHVTVHGERELGQSATSQIPYPQLQKQAIPSSAVLATPAVRQTARELGVELSMVKGSGPGGRITPDDVKVFSQNKGQALAVQSQSQAQMLTPQATPQSVQQVSPQQISIQQPSQQVQAQSAQIPWQPQFPSQFQQQPQSAQPQPRTLPSFDGPTTRVALTQLRKAVARKMVESAQAIPHVTHVDEADVTELWAVREQLKKLVEERTGVKLTLLPFLAKAVVEVLKKFPNFNASYDEAAQELVLKNYFNLGFAVDTPEGLMVVVVKDADKKPILQIASEINDLAGRARERKVKLDELKNSTFSITNIGSYGGVAATPIINHPETAILALYRMRQKPVVREGIIVARNVMPISVTFDHRVIDGGDAARFVNEIIKMAESPQASGLAKVE
ncbi:2-oxo acid dehydrogenase subunit E2 [Candidatus Micrarchaeota archaeon]|nr:2-oxo acid dehydrogenase subunit E2 [Candidatus Micrarchaeota archaeon]